MKRAASLAILTLLALPGYVAAQSSPSASFSAGRALLAASSSPGNAYAAGMSVILTAPVAGDLSAVGGSVVAAGPVSGDELLIGGSVNVRTRVGGDVRAVAGSVRVEAPVKGDFVALGWSVFDSGRPGGNVFIAAASADLKSGAAKAATIYGDTVSLGGDFGGDVTVVTSGRLSLAPDTVIHGRLSYTAPEPAVFPDSVVVTGGIDYTNAAYIPNAATSRTLSLLSIGLFLLVRILGALILAGLLAGFFPRLAASLVERARGRPTSLLLTILLGFAAFVAAPALAVLLVITFVGIWLALLLLVAYALLALLSLMYAGIIFGGLLARFYARRTSIHWHDGVIGTLALSLLALVPVLGPIAVFLLTLFAAGALLSLFFHFIFPREER